MQSEQLETQQIKKTSVKKSKASKKEKVEVQENQSVEQNTVSVLQDTVSVLQDTTLVQKVSSELEDTTTIQVEQSLDYEQTEQENTVVLDSDVSSLLDFVNATSDRISEFSKFIKESSFDKDDRNKLESSIRKLQKSFTQIQNAYSDYLLKQLSLKEKNSFSKLSGVKKVQDKEKSAIHKKLVVHNFLLNFMKLEPGTLVSRSAALSAITGYVKEEKINNPDIIVENDKRSFKIIGELKVLFNGIEAVMKSKDLLINKEIPTQIRYTDIMQYMTHCFVKPDETTVA